MGFYMHTNEMSEERYDQYVKIYDNLQVIQKEINNDKEIFDKEYEDLEKYVIENENINKKVVSKLLEYIDDKKASFCKFNYMLYHMLIAYEDYENDISAIERTQRNDKDYKKMQEFMKELKGD